jgi:hypothetical protein
MPELSRVKILIEYFVSKIYKNQFKKKNLDFRNSINIWYNCAIASPDRELRPSPPKRTSSVVEPLQSTFADSLLGLSCPYSLLHIAYPHKI